MHICSLDIEYSISNAVQVYYMEGGISPLSTCIILENIEVSV